MAKILGGICGLLFVALCVIGTWMGIKYLWNAATPTPMSLSEYRQNVNYEFLSERFTDDRRVTRLIKVRLVNSSNQRMDFPTIACIISITPHLDRPRYEVVRMNIARQFGFTERSLRANETLEFYGTISIGSVVDRAWSVISCEHGNNVRFIENMTNRRHEMMRDRR